MNDQAISLKTSHKHMTPYVVRSQSYEYAIMFHEKDRLEQIFI